MSDLVERLRQWAKSDGGEIWTEAANRINYLEGVCESQQTSNESLAKIIEGLETKYEALMGRYNDLLCQVAIKHPNESRHDTAKRYIRQAEEISDDQKVAMKEDDDE